MTPEGIRKRMLDGLGETNEVFTALETEQKWLQLETYFNLVLHAYYMQELSEYLFEPQYWQILSEEQLDKLWRTDRSWRVVATLNNGDKVVRQTSPWLFGIGEKN